MSESISYTAAYSELQTIVAEMENGHISVDELAEKVKRSTLLIDICRKKLTTTEEEVSKILQELDTKEETTEA